MVIKIVPKYKHNDMLQLLLAAIQRTSTDIIIWPITAIDSCYSCAMQHYVPLREEEYVAQ